jgi:hypothetical protein
MVKKQKTKIDVNNISINKFIDSEVVKDIHAERKTHLEKTFDYCDVEGSILEFGVFQGTTINIISNYFNNQTCYGFDSFEGLPEPWLTKKNSNKTSFPEKKFALEKLPEVNNNVKLIKGYFDETLPNWISQNTNPIKLLHIDCDLYSSTVTIFKFLNKFIVPGTVIIFDELYHWEENRYSNWEEGEWKALKEWITENNRSFEILHRNRHMQCAIKVLK